MQCAHDMSSANLKKKSLKLSLDVDSYLLLGLRSLLSVVIGLEVADGLICG